MAAGLLASSLTALGAPAPAAAASVADGSRADRAAPSCWAAKQADPAAADGLYWLQTSRLVSPEQFYCDMTTDGGGWVLVGRGREGWTFGYNGQGTAKALRETPSGPGAFAPAALPATTIEGLLDGTRVDALTDGVRVRRATESAGTSYQEIRWHLSGRATWSWAFDGGEKYSDVSVDGVSYGAARTRSWSKDGALLNVQTNETAANGFKRGFAYGSAVAGADDGVSALWQQAGGTAVPFTQVFLRPRLMSSTYTAPPAGGLSAQAVRALADTKTSPSTPWGVTGVVGGGTGETNLEVQTFVQIGSTMYVGGKFASVQKGANPGSSEKVDQPYLAAFDVRTGEWRSGFRPVLDGTVWDLAATASGKLLVGGEFTSVDGAPNTAALAALDPATGALDTTWRVRLEQVSTAGVVSAPVVRALDVQGSRVYAGGRFTFVTGGVPSSPRMRVGRMVRLSASDGTPDGLWKPVLDGTPVEIDANAAGDRVYLVGYFGTVDDTPANKVAVLSTASGAALVPGMKAWHPSVTDPSLQYQQTVLEVGDSVWQGGSQHVLGKYARSDYAFAYSHITNDGGDFQALASMNGVVYASCHCWNFDYSGTILYPWPKTFSDVQDVHGIIAYDAATGAQIPGFVPAFGTRGGDGVWELTPDSYGCLWFGGDVNRGSWEGSDYQWLGGFGKLCPRDSAPPTRPGSLKVAAGPSGNALSWTGSSDASGPVTYQVYRRDRVVATTTATSFTDTTGVATDPYWVRAVDATGNASASTARAMPTSTLVARGASWRWSADGTDRGTAWRAAGFDDAAWSTGQAQLGYGDGDETTVVPVPGPAPVTSYFRTSFAVPSADPTAAVRLSLLRDDGAVVYLNGTEVARSNMPTGTVTARTYASTAVDGTAESAWATVTVPASRLRAGTNVLAVEVHQAKAGTADLSFAAGLTSAAAPPQLPQPPQPPVTTTSWHTIVAKHGAWWYHDRANSRLGPTWRALGAHGKAWRKGRGVLGFRNGNQRTVLRTGQRTYYFRHGFTLTHPRKVTRLALRLLRDDGAAVYLNGHRVARSNMPSRISYRTYASRGVGPKHERTYYTYLVPVRWLRAGTNVLAVEVHQARGGGGDLSFDASFTARW